MSPFVAWWIGGSPAADGHLVWTGDPTTLWLAAAAALIAWALSLPGARAWPWRVAEAALWGAALAPVLVALAGPTWVEESGHTEPGRVAVLVDASRSMGVLEGGTPRSARAQAIIEQLAGPQVDVYHFGDDLTIGAPPAYALEGTDLEGALVALSERTAGERLAGVVVISDGIDRGLLRKRFLDDASPSPPPSLPGPLTVYQVGGDGALVDLSVRTIDTGGYGFVRSAFPIDAHLLGLGYAGRTVQATLLRDGAPFAAQSVTLDANGQGVAHFEVQPDTAGRFTYAVQVPVFADDAVPSNNTLPAVVRVVRDRVRVLQVAGTPSWDVKFLRRFLKGDPGVDLVSFFILRTERDLGAGFDQRELSLIPFPHEQLFTEDLSSFDLVIFQNFDYAPYFDQRRGGPNALLQNIRRFVEEDGHAFAMLGGDRSFDLGQYAGTPVGDMLPVTLGVPGKLPDAACAALCDAAPFRPALTEEGRRHPITRLASDPAENEAWWGRLHPSDGANVVLGEAAGAATLLTHPTRTLADGAPMPVLAVREFGKGRTLALTTDASWRWSFSEAAEGRGNQAYLRFWKNAFRWLVADPTVARVVVETPRENYALGDVVRVVVRARDAGFAPLPNAKVQATLTGEGREIPLVGVTGPDGEVALEWTADQRGAMRVRATVTEGDATIGAADTVFAVTTRDPELDEVVPDGRFLRWVAGDGRYYAVGERGPPMLDPKAGRTVWDRQETPLWRAPALALIAGFAAGLAWIVRRRAGLR